MKKGIFLVTVVLFFMSCAPYKAIDLTRVSLGMSKEEVYTALKKKPDNVIGSTQYGNDVLEVMQYTRYDAGTMQIAERYYLYFLNGKLKQWGRPGDWRKEADRIYEYRNG
ncbi:hypothetical protein [Sediminibacterium ginsengisoli]|nr:hypothetical protein [Sediminibacterium ginsengisoli]